MEQKFQVPGIFIFEAKALTLLFYFKDGELHFRAYGVMSEVQVKAESWMPGKVKDQIHVKTESKSSPNQSQRQNFC
jgi:hypothetical protein